MEDQTNLLIGFFFFAFFAGGCNHRAKHAVFWRLFLDVSPLGGRRSSSGPDQSEQNDGPLEAVISPETSQRAVKLRSGRVLGSGWPTTTVSRNTPGVENKLVIFCQRSPTEKKYYVENATTAMLSVSIFIYVHIYSIYS